MTQLELVSDIRDYLSMSGALPNILPDNEIIRVIENECKPWFFQNYYYSNIKSYLYIPKSAFKTEQFTQYKTITLPCNIQNVVWVYQVNDTSLFSLGVNAPNLSVNLGVSNQPYLSSITTTIGELGVYKVIIDGFSDMLSQLTKHTLKYDFNMGSKQLNILTSMGLASNVDTLTSLVLEVYEHIADEDLFDLDHFRRFVRATAGIQLGRLLLRFQYTLPGGVQINSTAVLQEAKEDLEKVKEEIKTKTPTNAIIMMVKR